VIKQLAEKSGFSVEAAKARLAELSPCLMDKVTPEGGLHDMGQKLLGGVVPPIRGS
jgi:uncharacterized protein YidB (DUF937 family)